MRYREALQTTPENGDIERVVPRIWIGAPMNKTQWYVRKIALAAVIAGSVSFTTGTHAQTVIALPPNLKPLPASNFSLVADTSGGSTLRFSTTSWNSGTGPLQLEAGSVDTGSGKQQVLQRVFNSDGTSALLPVRPHPRIIISIDDYAPYTLQPVAPGGYR
jgi:hypothetical protein